MAPKKLAVCLALALSGCAVAPPAADAEQINEFGGECNAAPAQYLAGRQMSDALRTEAMRKSGSAMVRVIRPGDAVTMDYQTGRLNIELDRQERVATLHCG